MIRFVALILITSSSFALTKWENGMAISKKGTKNEITYYQKDTVKWFVVFQFPNKKPQRLPITEVGKRMDIFKGYFCEHSYEYSPTGDPLLGKMNIRQKELFCSFDKKQIDLVSQCYLNEKKSLPIKYLGKMDVYLECDLKLTK